VRKCDSGTEIQRSSRQVTPDEEAERELQSWAVCDTRGTLVLPTTLGDARRLQPHLFDPDRPREIGASYRFTLIPRLLCSMLGGPSSAIPLPRVWGPAHLLPDSQQLGCFMDFVLREKSVRVLRGPVRNPMAK
jgi:hypothetical protein